MTSPRSAFHGTFIPLLLAACLLTLVPLAHASPPDPTWIGGIYDNADGDDVVLAATGAVVTVEATPTAGLDALPILGPLLAIVRDAPRPPRGAASLHSRAPPLV